MNLVNYLPQQISSFYQLNNYHHHPVRKEALKNNFETDQPLVYFPEQQGVSKISYYKIIKLTVQSLLSTHQMRKAITDTMVLGVLVTSAIAVIYFRYRMKLENYLKIGDNRPLSIV
jgi:hypothetical protein